MFEKLNQLGSQRVPFLFVISFDKQKVFVKELDKLDDNIFYKLQNKRNYPQTPINKSYYLNKSPIDYQTYYQAITKVKEQIAKGNTYLLNLTFQTPIESNLSLLEIFRYSKAKFKLYFKDEFICFSPERFVNITDNTIATYPMKGTIDANIPNAASKILANQKEMAEHTMIVDLMRNDLGIIANDIKVESFRYIDKIQAGKNQLLQVSSKITAKLTPSWHSNIGDILDAITPAGSITGTPKKKTIEIINDIEEYNRDFYTGIFGIYDGDSLDSAVMIRFIDKQNNQLYYKSGGGITIDSNPQDEYQELLDKIYLAM
jgi:para-aminobenzoate synthetase component 1